ncbi:MAG TPA: NADH-quinone oxidoreductase subunit A [Gemmataceae bacterium]|nr:NADH-quinone oxidoreductase subunit A [Gemmataceae bacterium]
MYTLTFVLSAFLVISIFFLFIHLVMGHFIRPANPEADKLTIYECGEPTIGSAWIQFDLRYYVVALLFVIFDVEVAFFFPWAITFGKANELARDNLTIEKRDEISKQMVPSSLPSTVDSKKSSYEPVTVEAASNFAWIAMADIAVFFGVLLVGFAYLWKRGDIDWVKTVAAEAMAEPPPARPVLPKPSAAAVLMGAGQK